MKCKFNKHCLKLPIPEECLEYCSEKYLRAANPEQKELILGLDYELAIKLYRVYNSYNIRDFDELSRRLNKDEVYTILDTFRHLNQFQMDFFSKSNQEKQDIIDNIKGSNLGL